MEELRDSWFGLSKRHASPQAWRRLRAALGPSEAADIARDIAAATGADPAEVEYALVDFDWESRKQA